MSVMTSLFLCFVLHAAYWITHDCIKRVFDEEDRFHSEKKPIELIRKIMFEHFQVRLFPSPIFVQVKCTVSYNRHEFTLMKMKM